MLHVLQRWEGKAPFASWKPARETFFGDLGIQFSPGAAELEGSHLFESHHLLGFLSSGKAEGLLMGLNCGAGKVCACRPPSPHHHRRLAVVNQQGEETYSAQAQKPSSAVPGEPLQLLGYQAFLERHFQPPLLRSFLPQKMLIQCWNCGMEEKWLLWPVSFHTRLHAMQASSAPCCCCVTAPPPLVLPLGVTSLLSRGVS